MFIFLSWLKKESVSLLGKLVNEAWRVRHTSFSMKGGEIYPTTAGPLSCLASCCTQHAGHWRPFFHTHTVPEHSTWAEWYMSNHVTLSMLESQSSHSNVIILTHLNSSVCMSSPSAEHKPQNPERIICPDHRRLIYLMFWHEYDWIISHETVQLGLLFPY